jgi:hypothetical protein
MEFKEFNTHIQNQFKRMCETGKLFKSNISGQTVWDTYLNSFKKEDNKRFRDPESSENNCNCCKNFIRRYGNILSVNIDNGTIESIFSNIDNVNEFTNSVKTCDKLLRNSKIEEVFFETYEELDKNLNYQKVNKNLKEFRLGIEKNFKQYTKEEVEKFGVVNSEDVYTFNHFHMDLPKQFVDISGKSIETIRGLYRDKKFVFKRAMEEIPLDTLLLVRDLILQGSLLDGNTHLPILEKIIIYKEEWNLNLQDKDIFAWIESYSMHEGIAKFKNHLIGVLCSELAEGKELNEAVLSWNKRVDPVNYHKAKAPITEAQKKLAEKFVIENGYLESFNRRLATMDDIKSSEILHKNVDNIKGKTVTIFDSVKTPSGSGQHKRSEFDKIEEVSINKFMTDILPNTTNIEVFLENRFENNLVNLTTSNESNVKQIFKWDNPFSYTFNGNLAGKSQIKQKVKSAGGNIDGVLRFSMIWNDIDGKDFSDLDAWCIQPDKQKIGYSTEFRKDRSGRFSSCDGQLDLDNTNPAGQIAIENIYFKNIEGMLSGDYEFHVNQFSARHSQGFKAEIEFNNEIFTYEYNQPIPTDKKIKVAQVTLKNGEFTIKHLLPETNLSKELYQLQSGMFHKVNLVCLTPNHWGNNNIGNKHYLFMLQGCKNPNSVRGFHNEHLISDLLTHRKVLDILGNYAMIKPTDNQLAGIGFNATVRDELIVRLSGTHKRTLKIKF